MAETVKRLYPDEVKQPWRVYSQVRKFLFDLKKGDIVLIPSPSHISFGEIVSDVCYTEIAESDIAAELCPFQKRREVKWLKTVRRNELDPYLYRLLYSQFALTSANEYASFIDRTLHSFFVKGDKAHVVLKVKTNEKVYLRDINRLTNGILDVIDIYNRINGQKLNSNEIELKMNVQSPGPIEFIGVAGSVVVIGVYILAVAGGGVGIRNPRTKQETTIETPGILNTKFQFEELTDVEKTQMSELQKTMEKLEVELPQELTHTDFKKP